MSDASGLVVVDKPAGWTSHQVVGRCRRLYGTRKVGHAGTLDPMATGVLLVGVNRATRLLGFLAGHDKTYTATIRLGASTVTDDAEGEPVEWPGAAGITEADVRAALPTFTGVISQVPSAVSAIKVDGKRAYARVRAGEEVELKPREVTVSRFEVTGSRPAAAFGWIGGEAAQGPLLDVDVEVDCSSGTYIRALARDLGRMLGCGGHLSALRRTRVGAFDLSLVALDADSLAGEAGPPLLGLAEVARRAFPVVEVDAAAARDVGFGRPLAIPVPADPTAVLHDGELLALYRPTDDDGDPGPDHDGGPGPDHGDGPDRPRSRPVAVLA
ncbi:tRNA pseudouridine(55) synthase TruB [Propionicimonas sp.]|uniref:tRNA pseudouridine(55) synthase TruB n=1 Tax=Propionicimonas sp. TaxID=1955623 RepID=UPI003D1312AC